MKKKLKKIFNLKSIVVLSLMATISFSLVYQALPFYITKEGSKITPQDIKVQCRYNQDYMDKEKYIKKRNECLSYINQKTNKQYSLHNYFGIFEKDNIVSVYTANNHHLFRFDVYKIQDNNVALIKSFYLLKPYKISINKYDFVSDSFYINVLGLNLTESDFLGIIELGRKDINLQNKNRLEKLLEGIIE